MKRIDLTSHSSNRPPPKVSAISKQLATTAPGMGVGFNYSNGASILVTLAPLLAGRGAKLAGSGTTSRSIRRGAERQRRRDRARSGP
ncbi:hypothetical protein [Synechococcus sp. CS-205]|uniref:hypothetical protein n=1 Tax=Synechococcus sp. CS-205 TaxID=2847984 RepID=UPI00223AD4A1|nr:hypothetical protein [Synechococcus sp. CS-205]MCT0249769.1 hypothetical protein [Synechococcus sp. CS-205]